MVYRPLLLPTHVAFSADAWAYGQLIIESLSLHFAWIDFHDADHQSDRDKLDAWILGREDSAVAKVVFSSSLSNRPKNHHKMCHVPGCFPLIFHKFSLNSLVTDGGLKPPAFPN